jgi:hypothetical protein
MGCAVSDPGQKIQFLVCIVIAEQSQTRKTPRRVLRYALTGIVLIGILVAWLGTGEVSEQLPAETGKVSEFLHNNYKKTMACGFYLDSMYLLVTKCLTGF